VAGVDAHPFEFRGRVGEAVERLGDVPLGGSEPARGDDPAARLADEELPAPVEIGPLRVVEVGIGRASDERAGVPSPPRVVRGPGSGRRVGTA